MTDPDRLREAFRSLTGRDAAGVWSAPGRVNLIGEHTDYNQGFVLPIAIDARTYIAAAPRSDGVLRGWSAQEPEGYEVAVERLLPGSLAGWASYACGPAWVMGGVPGADLVVDSDVPPGAGLSSSAALLTSVALALSDLAGTPLSGTALAEVAHRAESEFVGVPVGTMDQMVCALGRRGKALFLDTRDGSFHHVPFDLARSGLSLVVIDTRVVHRLREGEYARRRKTCEAAAAALGLASLREANLAQVESLPRVEAMRARHVVTENHGCWRSSRPWAGASSTGLGPAFVRSHRSLSDLYEVSCPELDLAVDSAVPAGALGARMTGGGFGGSAIALVETEKLGALQAAVTSAFAGAGLAEPRLFEVRASEGATAHESGRQRAATRRSRPPGWVWATRRRSSEWITPPSV